MTRMNRRSFLKGSAAVGMSLGFSGSLAQARPFAQVRLVPERFPVKTRLHRGLKATLYNDLFVTGFNVLPRAVVRPFGWHIIAFAQKNDGM